MKDKKKFEVPELRVIRFDETDIIATSATGNENYKKSVDKVVKTAEFNPFDGSNQ